MPGYDRASPVTPDLIGGLFFAIRPGIFVIPSASFLCHTERPLCHTERSECISLLAANQLIHKHFLKILGSICAEDF